MEKKMTVQPESMKRIRKTILLLKLIRYIMSSSTSVSHYLHTGIYELLLGKTAIHKHRKKKVFP